MTKKKTLVNESVIRRWGKLANMPSLTENFLGSIQEEEDPMEDEMAAGEDEFAAGEVEMEAGEEAEAEVSAEEQAAVERIVTAVVTAISDETGVEIEVEGDGEEAEMDDLDAGLEAAEELGGDAEAELGDADAAMRDPYSRKDEVLNIDVISDESLTEAVLQRVVARLLRRK